MKSAMPVLSSVLFTIWTKVGTTFANFTIYTPISANCAKVDKWTVDFFSSLLQYWSRHSICRLHRVLYGAHTNWSRRSRCQLWIVWSRQTMHRLPFDFWQQRFSEVGVPVADYKQCKVGIGSVDFYLNFCTVQNWSRQPICRLRPV